MVRLFRRKKKEEEEEKKEEFRPPPFTKRDLLAARPIRNPMIEWEKSEEGSIILYVKQKPSKVEKLIAGRSTRKRIKRIVLDEVGSFVWELCDGKHTVQDIIKALAEKYKLRRIEAERSLIEFLKMLSQRMLVGFLVGKEEGKK